MKSQTDRQEPKDLALFRTAAVEAAAGPQQGAALIAAPPGFWLTAVFLTASASALVALLVFGTYTQRETVSGYVAVSSGDLRIFPQAAGTVTGLKVSEGQSVAAGAPLFSLLASRNAGMPTAANREILQAVTLERSALVSQAREQSLYFAAEDVRLKQLVQNMSARLSLLQQQEQLARQKSNILRRDLERARVIQTQGHLSRRELDALEIAALDSELQWRTASLQLVALEAERQDASARLAQLSSLQGTRLAEIAEASSQLAQRETAVRATVLQTVVAPVAGRISALHVSEGQTVLADTLALSLLPATAQFHAELLVPARSVGMLEESARVQLRFDSYPFEKYGVHGATVERIARSLLLPGDARLPVAIAEPVYRVRATLDRQHVEVDGSRRALTAGITLKADILVSERTLLEWILAPVLSAGRRL
ncbi:MAG TPA: HlyD family efflux transporter periplasmic adaptor subunit [Woeseiaceae bacterium]|nr:HlyD family efflux transporter periplasmic adaptor subunit [Woeseiaceae bacterium]